MTVKELYGQTSDGKKVYKYSLTNDCGASASFINFGLILQSLNIPDKQGKFEDVVLGYDRLEDYVKNNPYFGAIVGRYGNRIGNASFNLEGHIYRLAQNNGSNHLHGGITGFDKKYWDIEISESDSSPALLATLVSEDGDEGYPGEVRMKIKIVLSQENELIFDYTGITDKPTILNPTHHSYFNLSGSPQSTALDNRLQINAESYTPVNAGLIPTGEISAVVNTPLDFREMKTIGYDINADFEQIKHGAGFDHNWVINNYQEGVARKAATLFDPKSGRVMEVFTDQPGMQFYSGNFLDDCNPGKGNAVYRKNYGLCFEAQHYPDSPNNPDWPSARLLAGQVYKQTTSYKFLVK